MKPPPRSSVPRSTTRTFLGPLFAAVVLAAAILLVYHNALDGPFIFDDETSIVLNPAIRSLWPPWAPLMSPPDTTVAGRPVVGISLAVDYALHGLDVAGYHASNIAFHVLAALLLLGVVRSTLRSAPLEGRFGRHATGLALTISLIWALHPLQTESVDYVVERTEILMGVFFLLTLLCTILGSRSSRPWPWYAAAWSSCALGMGSKEVMVVAPLLVLLYDAVFLADSLRAAWSKRRGLYAGLAICWLVLALPVATGAHGSSAGFSFADLTVPQYAATQPGVILHYLRLCFWPHPLVVDYFDWPTAGTVSEILPAGALVALLLALTAWGLARKPPLGFLGAWFFLILAPTSSFLPLRGQLAAERRMYLPLVPVVALVALGLYRWLPTSAAHAGRVTIRSRTAAAVLGAVVVVVVVVLGRISYLRNQDYRSAVSVWSDVVAKRPGNARARNNLGIALSREGRYREAAGHLGEALRLKDDFAEAYNNLGIALARQGRLEPAMETLEAGLRVKPDSHAMHYNLADALARSLRWAEATEHYSEAIRLRTEPFPEALRALAMAHAHQGRLDDAERGLRRTLELKPQWPQALLDLALVLTSRGDASGRAAAEATLLAERACELGACRNAEALDVLASAYAGEGRFADAVRAGEQAERLARAAGQESLLAGIQGRLLLYREGRPFRAVPGPVGTPGRPAARRVAGQ